MNVIAWFELQRMYVIRVNRGLQFTVLFILWPVRRFVLIHRNHFRQWSTMIFVFFFTFETNRVYTYVFHFFFFLLFIFILFILLMIITARRELSTIKWFLPYDQVSIYCSHYFFLLFYFFFFYSIIYICGHVSHGILFDKIEISV